MNTVDEPKTTEEVYAGLPARRFPRRPFQGPPNPVNEAYEQHLKDADYWEHP